MKAAALLTALVLTGCAVQPAYQPDPPATEDPAISRHNDCVDALASLLAYARVGRPILKQCFAGDGVQCDAFLLFRAGMSDRLRIGAAVACLETGGISPFHPLVASINDELPSFNKQLRRFDAMQRR